MKHATKEHYKILQIDEKADLEQIKKAYRKRAFELHPDLNPNNPDANKQFQLLNEAYVILIAQTNTYKTSAKKTNEQYKTQASSSKSSHSASQKTKEHKEEDKKEQETKQEYQKRESHKRTYSKTSSNEDLRKKAQNAYTKEGNKAQSKVYTQNQEETKEEVKTPTQEEVLNDILSDPFARRVYEDIYSSLKNNEPKKEEKKKKESIFSKITPDWNVKTSSPKLDDGISTFMKGWMKKQIDDTLEFRLPITSLYPGSRIRLQIAQGLAKETKTVDLTLPRDFVIGKPVRLEGLGKKIGKWKGDLFITLLPILPEEKK